jgi:hypothetical protein
VKKSTAEEKDKQNKTHQSLYFKYWEKCVNKKCYRDAITRISMFDFTGWE